MNRLIRLLIVCFAIVNLAGCAGIFDPGPPMAHVILPVRMPVATVSNRMPIQLLVAHPVTDAATETDRILALMNGYEIRALDLAKWVSPVPSMVQRMLIDSLEASRRLEAVGWEESGIDASVKLATDIRRFYLRYDDTGAPPAAELTLIFSLTDMDSGKVFARKAVSAQQPCAGNSVKEFVAAFSVAMTKVLAESDAWIIQHLEERLAAAKDS